MIRFDCALARPGFRFDAAFEAGQGVTALIGPSGAGKSTAVRLLAGLETPDHGRITWRDETLLETSARIAVPTHRRRMGLVFQDAQLLPHLSVAGNLRYGRWFTPSDRRVIGFDPVVDVLGIGHLLDRRPSTLSGGERQRVAIGRALLASPRLLLMDEPLASLDQARKSEILPFIERLRDEFAIPIVYVSHSLEEVARLAAHVVRFRDGRVAAAGPPGLVLADEETGAGERLSVLMATVARRRPEFGVTVLAHPAGEIVAPGLWPDGQARVAIRASAVTLALRPPDGVSTRTMLSGRVLGVEPAGEAGALAMVELVGGDRIAASLTRWAAEELGLVSGREIVALVKTVALAGVGAAH